MHFEHTVLLIGLFKTVTSEMMIILFLKTCGAAKFSGGYVKCDIYRTPVFERKKRERVEKDP